MTCEDSRYTKKLAILFQSHSNTLDPYPLLDAKWVNDPTKWPTLEFPQVYTYLIESPGIFTKEQLKVYKSLKAYNYYISGWVQTVLLFVFPDTSNCILKAKVRPSQKMNEQPYVEWVGLHATTGNVINGHCTCMTRLGEICSHIVAVLFKVEAFHRVELGKASCTFLLCAWNQAFTKKEMFTM
jgi:hypothetical protein